MLIPAILLAGLIAGIAGVYLLVIMTVKWPEPLPWEDATPYVGRVTGGATLAPGVLILLGPDIVGRVSDERPKGPELATLRIKRTVQITGEARFTLHTIDGRQTVLVVPARKGESLSPWDEVRIDPIP